MDSCTKGQERRERKEIIRRRRPVIVLLCSPFSSHSLPSSCSLYSFSHSISIYFGPSSSSGNNNNSSKKMMHENLLSISVEPYIIRCMNLPVLLSKCVSVFFSLLLLLVFIHWQSVRVEKGRGEILLSLFRITPSPFHFTSSVSLSLFFVLLLLRCSPFDPFIPVSLLSCR